MKTLIKTADLKEILERISLVRPESPRQWGRMNAHQMIVHLTDSFRHGLGDKIASQTGGVFDRVVIKRLALYLPTKWPRGLQTRPEMDQEIGGTPLGDFEQDVRDLGGIVLRFTNLQEFEPHPAMGRMTYLQWQRWGFLHADHHLRQFGL